MEITQERLNELKSQIKIQEPLGTLIQNSLVVGGKPENELIRRAAVSPDCQSFDFGISSVLKISGSICKSGKLDIVVIAFGIEIGHTTVDLSKGEFCQNPELGKLVGVKYCFSLKNNCLYTRGELDGWFEKRMEWNEKLLCFPTPGEPQMNEGKCGARHYGNIDKAKIDVMLKELRDSGATVTGNNPWDVDTHNHGVKLRGTWGEASSTLTVIVTDKSWYVPCSKIWDVIDPLIHHIQGLSAAEIEEVT